MIRAEIRFKNSAFIKALEKNGYDSIAEFSRAVDVNYISLVEYANLRYIFKDIKVKVRIAELLNSDLHVLFDQYEKVVEKNKKNPRKIAREIPIENMLSTSSKQVLQLQSDYDTEDIDHSIGIKKEVGDAINTLKDREKLVIKLHFGIGVKEPMALSDIAEEIGLTKERTRQIKDKAIRRLRHRARSNKLRPYALISPSAKKEALNEIEFTPSSYGYSQKHTRFLEQEKKKTKGAKRRLNGSNEKLNTRKL